MLPWCSHQLPDGMRTCGGANWDLVTKAPMALFLMGTVNVSMEQSTSVSESALAPLSPFAAAIPLDWLRP